MKSQEQIFDYVKLLNDVKKHSNKSQSQISEELGCTAIHTSNVKRQKSSYSMEKIIKLINSGEYCLDDYVQQERSPKISGQSFDNKNFNGIPQTVIKVLQEFFYCYIQTSQKEKQQQRKKEYTNEDLAKLAGEKIHKIRIEKGIRADKIAQKLGVKEGSYRNMENGNTGTTPENYAKIAKILDISISEIFEEALENKKPIIEYRMRRIFEELSEEEVGKYGKMMEEFIQIVKKYSI